MLTPWSKRVDAVLEAWYPGSEGGSAIARVLFGKVDASGRLPVTFPRSEADLPTAGNENAYPGVNDVVDYAEGLFVGYRHYDATGIRPAYSFGHGLSYTKFRFSDLRIKPAAGGSKAAKRGRSTVSVAVTNTGRRRGIAVPQLYLSLPPTDAVPQPPKALKGFERIKLAPGKTKRVRFALSKRAFSYWDAGKNRWRVVAGCVRVLVGSSSRKTPLKARVGRTGTCRH
jgi:beta-glucosidase